MNPTISKNSKNKVIQRDESNVYFIDISIDIGLMFDFWFHNNLFTYDILACFLFTRFSFSLHSPVLLFYFLLYYSSVLFFSFLSFLPSFSFLLLINYSSGWFYLFYIVVLNSHVTYFQNTNAD